MYTLLGDLRYATRKLVRTPAFTIVAVLTLALAVGATTAIFSVVNSVLLNPLPFADPARLVFIESTDRDGKPMPAAPQDLSDYRDQSHAFTTVAAVVPGENVTLTRPSSAALRLSEARVGALFFAILGVRPQAGRFFAPGEDSKGSPKVVVLSDLAWRRYFGGDPRVVGENVTLDKEQFRVIGIAAPGLTFPQGPDVWVPAVWHDFEIGNNARGYHAIEGIARLRDGASVESARRELGVIAGRIAREFPRHSAQIGAFVQPLHEYLVGDVRSVLWSMLGAVAFVLLIACANVANLLLVRAASRESEMAVRTALGAGRRRLVRQLLTESFALSAGAAALGALLASWAVDAVIAFGPRGLPRINEISIDGHVLAFTALLAIATGLAFGVLPALHAARADISLTLHSGARGSSAGNTSRTRSALVLIETALAMVLLVGAGLLIRSFEQRLHVDPGFSPNHLLVFDVALSGDKYQYDQAVNAFANDVQSRLAALPGTQSVAVAADRPVDPDGPFGATTSFSVDGAPKPVPGSEPISRIMPVSPSYFTTLGMSLVRGRFFTSAENRLDAAPAIVINEELATRYFPNQEPIGKHLTFGLSHTVSSAPSDSVRVRGEVVGIVRNALHATPGEKAFPSTYFAYATGPFAATFLVRTNADPVMVEGEIRRQLREIDPAVPIYELGTMDDAMSTSVAQPRFYTILFGAFAGIALLLAALGIYGVISYLVSLRTREFGIRIALGATSRDVARLVVGRGLVLTIAGIAIGVIAATAVTRTIRSMLFGVGPLDALTFTVVGLLLAAIAALASWLPARDAAHVDPVIAMRAE